MHMGGQGHSPTRRRPPLLIHLTLLIWELNMLGCVRTELMGIESSKEQFTPQTKEGLEHGGLERVGMNNGVILIPNLYRLRTSLREQRSSYISLIKTKQGRRRNSRGRK